MIKTNLHFTDNNDAMFKSMKVYFCKILFTIWLGIPHKLKLKVKLKVVEWPKISEIIPRVCLKNHSLIYI